LKSDVLQNDIIQNLKVYDSLFIFDKSGFWNDNLTLTGFGFRNEACYKFIIFLEKSGETASALKIKKIDRDREPLFGALTDYLRKNYLLIRSINNDSLELQSRTNISISVSDQEHYSILTVYPLSKHCFLSSSYNPEFYQSKAWTKDRQILLDVFKRLEPHLDKHGQNFKTMED